MNTAREPHLVRFRVHAEDVGPDGDMVSHPGGSDDAMLAPPRPAPPPDRLTVLDRLDRWRDDPRARIAAIALVALLAGWYWYRSALDGGVSAVDAVALEEIGAPSDGAASVEDQVVVHVSGAVVRPGLLRLAPGARVADAIEAAGGAAADADLDQLNLAAPLGDGERVHVPVEGETLPALPGIAAMGPVNVNAASVAELETLPGVGPAIAQAIIAARVERRFETVDDLLRVRGIGPGKLEELRSLVTV